MEHKKGIENITREELLEHVKQLIKNTEPEVSEVVEPNHFPLSVFPDTIQDIVNGAHQNLNFPIDFTAASMLYAASVAIGNTFKVQIKRGFQESAVLYMAIVARAGTNKSHPLSFALQPIADHDKEKYTQYEAERIKYDKIMNLSKKERDTQSDNEPEKPVWEKFLVSDFTPEALVEVHRHNKRGIGVYIDELAGWFKNFNRYNQGSEMEFWLSTWSSKPISIDRKTGDAAFIPRPFISVAGTIQNAILYELSKQGRNKNGFMDRILFVIPDNLQKPYWSDKEIAPYLVKNWDIIMENLLNMKMQCDAAGNPEPQILHLSPDAKQILYDWQKQNADQCNEAESEEISGIYSKLEMYAVRLALILELLNYGCSNNDDTDCVSAKSMRGALQLVEYFKRSALKVHTIINNENPLQSYPTHKQELYKELPQIFTLEHGLRTAQKHNMVERTFTRFLKNKDLFKRISHGEYEKLI
jgi:Protein of unknown function (DUF3987)